MDKDFIKYGEFQPFGINNQKKRIILCHTSREVREYLTSLKFRFNGSYPKIPNYVITQSGEILKLLEDNQYSSFFGEKLDEDSIIICLENLGWLQKAPLKEYYINWIGNIYKGNIFEKKWRDYFLWHPYTDTQIEVCSKLCLIIIEKFGLEKKCVGHNTKVEGIENYNGIITKSNLDINYTDLSPSFNFEVFIEYLENE